MYELDLIWGWQPALYLFLGGLGAGAFFAAAALLLKGGMRYRHLVCVSSFAALACVAVGLLLLLAELIKPLAGMLVWRSFSHFTSWMTYGAWIAVGAMVCFAAMGLLTSPLVKGAQGAETAKATPETAPEETQETGAAGVPALLKAVAIVGMVFSFALAFYTGMLLMSAEGVAFWHTLLLPCLFTISAMDTGVALVELLAMGERGEGALAARDAGLLHAAVVVLVVAEVVVLALFVGLALAGHGAFGSYADAAAASARFVVAGGMALWFWIGVVLLGLVCPISVALIQMRGKAASGFLEVFGPSAALIGGCVLRFAVLFAGIHVDLVGAAVSML